MYQKIKSLIIILFLIKIVFSVNPLYAGTVKIAHSKDYYPYAEVNENGESVGILIDFWKLWSQKTGVEIEFVPDNLPGCIEKTLNAETDLIGGLFYSDERSGSLDFSDAILRMDTILFLSKELRIKSIDEIDSPVGIVRGDLAYSFLKENHPELEFQVFNSYSALIEKIRNQEISAFVYDYPKPTRKFRTFPPPEGYIKFTILYSERLRPAVKKGNKEMVDLIFSGLVKIQDEELFRISEQWEMFKEDIPYELIAAYIFGTLFLLIGGLLMYVRLRKSRVGASDGENSDADWNAIIALGENDFVEFKSTLRWDCKRGNVNKGLEHVIAKTISAFLNTEGGRLFIGVDDDGTLLGLENDYNSLSKKKNRDGFLLTLTTLINHYLGKGYHRFISIQLVSIEEKDLCIVTAIKSDSPAFLLKGKNEEFYIRASASSQPMSLRETYEYINSHWK